MSEIRTTYQSQQSSVVRNWLSVTPANFQLTRGEIQSAIFPFLLTRARHLMGSYLFYCNPSKHAYTCPRRFIYEGQIFRPALCWTPLYLVWPLRRVGCRLVNCGFMEISKSRRSIRRKEQNLPWVLYLSKKNEKIFLQTIFVTKYEANLNLMESCTGKDEYDKFLSRASTLL